MKTTTPTTMHEDVQIFHEQVLGYKPFPSGSPGFLDEEFNQFRLACLKEELGELEEAMGKRDFPEAVDGIIDLIYFGFGTLLLWNVPIQEVWNVVQAANVQKLPGKTKRGYFRDAIKPPGWKAPNVEQVLVKHGYCPPVAARPCIIEGMPGSILSTGRLGVSKGASLFIKLSDHENLYKIVVGQGYDEDDTCRIVPCTVVNGHIVQGWKQILFQHGRFVGDTFLEAVNSVGGNYTLRLIDEPTAIQEWGEAQTAEAQRLAAIGRAGDQARREEDSK